MAYRTGRTHYVNFRIVDINSNPVVGRVLSNLQVYFLRDDVICTDTPLTMTDLGAGEYVVTYVPNTAGFYYLELYDSTYDVRIEDAEEIDSDDTFFSDDAVQITQDTGGVGALKPTVSDPLNWTLFIFQSQLWQTGQNSPNLAEQSTTLTAQNNWVTTPLSVVHGTYHVVIISSSGANQVLAAFLKV